MHTKFDVDGRLFFLSGQQHTATQLPMLLITLPTCQLPPASVTTDSHLHEMSVWRWSYCVQDWVLVYVSMCRAVSH